MSTPTDMNGSPLPDALRDVDPRHLESDGPPHPDIQTERMIIRWALGYLATEPAPWERVEAKA